MFPHFIVLPVVRPMWQGEFSSIEAFTPQDATTNPSLIYKAAMLPEYKHLVNAAVEYALKTQGQGQGGSEPGGEAIDVAMDYLAVLFGKRIADIVPGYVSTEVRLLSGRPLGAVSLTHTLPRARAHAPLLSCPSPSHHPLSPPTLPLSLSPAHQVDARLSFDTEATVARAHRIVRMYEEMGVGKVTTVQNKTVERGTRVRLALAPVALPFSSYHTSHSHSRRGFSFPLTHCASRIHVVVRTAS